MAQIAAPTQNPVSPLLRFSSYEWSSISQFLGPGDIVRLLSTGSSSLIGAVRRGVRHLELTWFPGRYILFDEVFSTLKQFQLLLSLDFRAYRGDTLLWTPVSWSSLPSSLLSLKLEFFAAVGAFMSQDNLSAILPNLRKLIVQGNLESRGQLEDLHRINLGQLPESLIELRLSTSSRVILYSAHLEQLPRNLEILELSCEIYYAELEDTWSSPEEGAIASLPLLPDSLTHLSIFGGYHSGMNWHVDCGLLPSSLTYLHIGLLTRGTNSSIKPDHFYQRDLTLDLRGAATRLQNLKLFSCPELCLEVLEAAQSIPPSVTELNIQIKSAREPPLRAGGVPGLWQDRPNYSIDQLDFVTSRLTRWNCAFDSLSSAILNGTVSAPRLKHVLGNRIPILDQLPKSLTSYTNSASAVGGDPNIGSAVTPLWPDQLETLEIHFGNLNFQAYLFSPHSAIRSIVFLREDFSVSQLQNLPNTLESIQMTMDPSLLFEEMAKPGRLPNLKKLVSRMHLSLLRSIPRQLKYLSVSMICQPVDDRHSQHFEALRESNLETLQVSWSEGDPTHHERIVIQLLNHLPTRLKHFSTHSPAITNAHWDVKLPSGLETFEYQPWGLNIPKEPIESSPGAWALPTGLRSLSLVRLGLIWPVEELPPHLSVLIYNGSIPTRDNYGYFTSRPQPSSSLGEVSLVVASVHQKSLIEDALFADEDEQDETVWDEEE